jgi:diadenosine tetraphosphate (Ap4A) HIT family hydrolase
MNTTLTSENNKRTLLSLSSVDICVPIIGLNAWQDGGHLLVLPHRDIADRIECTASEAIEIMAATMLAGMALHDVLNVEKVNYQEMGNWSLGKDKKGHLHVHIFGRAHHQTFQIRAESIRFYPQGHPIYQHMHQPITDEAFQAMKQSIENNVKQESIKTLLAKV